MSKRQPNREALGFRHGVVFQDLRYAFRQLRQNIGFAATAILLLALGMGASVGIFAFVDAALIKPLPYANPSRLVGVFEYIPICPRCNLSYFDYLDWKKLNDVFSSLEAYTGHSSLLNTPAGVQAVHGARVSDGFFRTLGVTPILGRDFAAGEDLPAAPRTVILSYSTWKNRYAGRADVLGQAITLDGAPNVIVGVLPKDFHFSPTEPSEFWTTLHATSECEKRRSCHNLYGVARLKDGVSLQTASAAMALIAQQLEKQYPDSNRGQGSNIMALGDVIVGDVRPILLMLLSGTGLLLLIAGVNLASLLLIRSETRKREIAIRTALGAARTRLVRQFVTEGLLVVLGGSVAGLAFAYGSMKLLLKLIPADLLAHVPFLNDLGMNGHLLLFAAAIALVALVLFSLTPALRLSMLDMQDGLAVGSRGSAGTTWRRIGSKLVVLELTTAVVLLVAAGLLGKSLFLLLHVETGIRPDHLATLEVSVPENAYPKDEQMISLERKILAGVSTLPGVKAVGVSSLLPVSGNGNTTWIRILGRPYHGEHNEVNQRYVSSDYFATLQAKLLRGRFFTDAEDQSKPRVMLINRALARQYFPGEDPIGQKIGDTDLAPKSMTEIIGIVDDIREGSLESEIWPAVYYAFNQNPNSGFSLAVRTSQSEKSVLPTLASAIRQIDPEIATTGASTMTDLISNSPSAYIHRCSAWLVGGFAGVALVLGVVGLYGVVAYSVSQRTREIGVRIALGAQRGSVYQLVLSEAGRLAGAGIVIGLLCSIGAATLMRGLLFGVRAWDITTLSGVASVLTIAAMLASFIPARRAASVDPVDALRAE
jgi:macrolide transport system ATP-binding/permease protein